MPEHPIMDSIITTLNAQEPWPDNVKLFQPYEVEQILLPDNASCLAVQAFLKMCNLPFEVEMRWNAEFMSPSGRVPFIKCGAFVVSELEPIVQFAANKGVSLCGKLSTEEKAEMRAYMSLITNVLVNAELYISWIDNETFHTVTKVRNSSVYPWPLGWLQTRAKRNNVAKRLKALHWHEKTLDQVLADVEQCCNSLSQRLGEKDYFFGTPTALDALIYGHFRAILGAVGPKAALMIKPITTALLRHILRMNSLTGMKLTTQEDYLLTQAFQVSYRRRLSPERTISERSARSRRSKVSIRHYAASKENVVYSRDVFGFKPFACKQIVMMTSKDGRVTCRRNKRKCFLDEEHLTFAVDIIEDILDKVEEIAIDVFTEKIESEHEKTDFEVIVYPNVDADSKYDSADMKMDLGTIEEDLLSIDASIEDVIQIINDDEELGDLDSDGLVNEKHLASEIIDIVGNEPMFESTFLEDGLSPGSTDSSKKEESKESNRRERYSSGDRGSPTRLMPTKSASSTKSSRFSSDSKTTLKVPSDEEISVESLLKCLRKRNAVYHSSPEMVADID